MPTLDLSNEYVVFDNPEVLNLKNPDNTTASTNYGFRRGITTGYVDQSGMMKVENMTRFLIWKKNVSPWKPEIDCEITDATGKKYYANGVNKIGRAHV